jgi:hypothetical protein
MTFDFEVHDRGADVAASVTLSALELNRASNFSFIHGQRPAAHLRSCGIGWDKLGDLQVNRGEV